MPSDLKGGIPKEMRNSPLHQDIGRAVSIENARTTAAMAIFPFLDEG